MCTVVSVVLIMELFKTFFLSFFILHRAEVAAKRRAKAQTGDPYLRVCGLVPPHRSQPPVRQPPPPPSDGGQRHRTGGTRRSGDIGDSLNVFDGGGSRQFPSGDEDIVFRRPQLPKRRPDAFSPPDRTPPPSGEVAKFPVASAVHGKERGKGTGVGRGGGLC